MAEIEVLLPKMGESVAEATITTWLKAVGDTIEEEESLVEIATDKVDSEVPAPADGVVTQILVEEGDVAQVGQVIAIISTDGEAPAAPAAPKQETSKTEAAPAPAAANTAPAASAPAESAPVNFANADRFYSPLVKTIAKEENLSMDELNSIEGSGQNGRVTKKDVLNFISSGRTQAIVAPTAAPAKPAAAPKASTGPAPKILSSNDDVEIIEMDRMRKLIAKYMVDSKKTSPHVTSFVEADVTNIVNWRNKIKKAYEQREGEKITFTPIFIEAIVKAIKDFPMINISIDGDNIIRKKGINIGMATALPSGNLIVPVIKSADQLSLTGLSKQVNALANKARNNKLEPDDIAGGTYTISNVGSFGNVMGTPIINQPQVAIMAVGAIRKKPAVIETPQGDLIGIRHMMYLSHSYDHRVVDGALGGMFVRKMADYLESFDPNREF